MKKLGIFTIIGVVFLLCMFADNNFKTNKTASEVMETVMDKYEVQGYIIGDDSETIDVDVYNEDDIEKVEKYIKENLTEKDSDRYEIKVFNGWDTKH